VRWYILRYSRNSQLSLNEDRGSLIKILE
jgi:hypothetical protein